MILSDYLQTRQQRISAYMTQVLPDRKQSPQKLNQAVQYCLFNGGKRIRPLLVYATGESLGGETSSLDSPACAVEFIHCYSLIHDDLPAMDNSDLRRGNPTCHIAFDEATAILAGDALLTEAFHLLATTSLDIPANNKLKMIEVLAKAAGLHGMVAGQSLDLANCHQTISINDLKQIYQKKTGALIEASILLGALASPKSTEQQLQYLTLFGQHLGLAFQLIDDILDVTATDISGKPQDLDQANGKLTFVSCLGVEETKAIAQVEIEQALAALSHLEMSNNHLQELANFILTRKF